MNISTRTRRVWCVIIVAAFALTTACSPGSPDRADTVSVSTNDDETEVTAEETIGQEDGEAEGEPEAGGQETEAPEPADEPPGEPLATVEGQPPFASVEITDLRRVEDTVTLEFVMVTDDSADITPVRDLFAAPADLGGTEERRISVSGVTLVDQVNRKRHLVLRDSEGACLCTRFEGYVDANLRYPQSAQFPAPPDDVDRMTVQVPGFPAIDNVPLRVSG
jgi:hypothetical protein